MTKLINILSALLVAALAIVSLILSYNALVEVAEKYSTLGRLAGLWPVLIDGALVVFSLAVVRASLRGERAIWPWAMVALFTAGTVAFNLIHSESATYYWLVAIVPPVALFLSFETLMGMLKGEVKRGEALKTLPAILVEIAQKREEMRILEETEANRIEAERAKGQAEVDNLTGQKGQLQEEIELLERTIQSYKQDIETKRDELNRPTQETIKAYLPANLDINQRQDLVNRMANDNLTNEQIAALLGVSIGTVKNDKRAVKEVNGNGKH